MVNLLAVGIFLLGLVVFFLALGRRYPVIAVKIREVVAWVSSKRSQMKADAKQAQYIQLEDLKFQNKIATQRAKLAGTQARINKYRVKEKVDDSNPFSTNAPSDYELFGGRHL